ncbi:MAG: (Fe-S)-binding protein [Thermacetogeniaceae bacterium]
MESLATTSDFLKQCSRCGGCQAVCPLYAETLAEPYVARGKIFLIKNYLDGKIELSPKMKEIMSLCLLCKACVENCPNQVPVDRLVLAARREIARERGISFVKKNVFQHLLQNNGNLSLAARMGYLYQHSGVQSVVRKSGLLELISPDLAKKERLLPRVARRPFRSQAPKLITCSRPKIRVAYYTGCLTNYVYPGTGLAVLDVLGRNGAEVVIPDQWCCGIPALASGDEASAVALAGRNIETFQMAGVDAIITDCASCGSMLHDYADLIETSEARSFADKVMDFSRFLDDAIDFQPGDTEVPLAATYHDPCHLRRGQGVYTAPRKLIRAVPGLEFKEMNEADRCCGAAGSFNLTYYDLSTRIGKRKAENIRKTGAGLVVTGCPSCIMQLDHVLRLEQSPVQVMHLAELLSMSYVNGK